MTARSLHSRGVVIAAAFALVAGTAAPLGAQAGSQTATQSGDVAPGVIRACYIPRVGLVYLIKEPELLLSCLAVPVQHSEISWNRQGPQGGKGEPGPAGPAGADGAVGDKGPLGPPGPSGPAGDQGVAGDRGATGAPGAQGDKGPTGEQGPQGATGAAGDQGPVGDKGPLGPQGPLGEQGASGDRGAAGEKGVAGDKGPLGAQGPLGEKGPLGNDGPVGDKGPVGEKGPTGDKGALGPRGPDGLVLPCDNGCVTTPIIADLAVTNAKLAVITEPGKIANSATTATSINTVNRIVARDAAGSFAAGNVTVTDLLLSSSGEINHGATTRILNRRGGDVPESASIYFGTGAGPQSDLLPPSGDVGVGSEALNSIRLGGFNTAVGLRALDATTNTTANVAIGEQTMDALSNTKGSRNVFVGWRVARSAGGSRNIALGSEAAGSLQVAVSNVIWIGTPGVLGDGSTIRIGQNSTHQRAFIAGIENSTLAAGVPVSVTTVGVTAANQLGVATSSARFKTGVRDLGDASTTLQSLRPVSYRYRPDLDPGAVLQYGLVAEEVDRVTPNLVARDSAGRPYTVRYDMLVPLLVDDVQRRQRRLVALREQSAALLRRLEQLETVAELRAHRP